MQLNIDKPAPQSQFNIDKPAPQSPEPQLQSRVSSVHHFSPNLATSTQSALTRSDSANRTARVLQTLSLFRHASSSIAEHDDSTPTPLEGARPKVSDRETSTLRSLLKARLEEDHEHSAEYD